MQNHIDNENVHTDCSFGNIVDAVRMWREKRKHRKCCTGGKRNKKCHTGNHKGAARTSCDTLEWRGAKTLIKISRTPDNEGDIVTGEDDIKYLDNIVTLKITSGGNVIVDKPIRKSTFRNYMDSKTYKKFVLEWIVFNKIRNGNIMLAASVANPIQEDEFLSFAITVSPNGNISISKDENPDMSAPDNDNQQYDFD